jgi:hypothetical protein
MSSQQLASCPAWSIPGFLEVRGAHLNISGADALALVREFGSRPVFSEQRIQANIARLQAAAKQVDRPIKFCYASKANSNMGILQTVRDSGIDVEVNSGGELFKALRIGFRPDQIIFNGTSKSDDEIDDAVGAGIYAINVDSIYEIGLVERSVSRLRQGNNVPPARCSAPGAEIGTLAPGPQTTCWLRVQDLVFGSAGRRIAASSTIWSVSAAFTFTSTRKHRTSSPAQKSMQNIS